MPRGSTTSLTGGSLGPYMIKGADLFTASEAAESVMTRKYPYPVEEDAGNAVEDGDPADTSVTYTTSRNGIYVVILR